MRVLTVPNWSFGRDSDLLSRFGDLLSTAGVDVHYLRSDVDLNRTVSAFSGKSEVIFETVERLCDLAFPRIDLNHHVGAHPRIGALDVCPFLLLPDKAPRMLSTLTERLPDGPEMPLPESDPQESLRQSFSLIRDVEAFAAKLAGTFEIPVFLYEKSERGRHEADLPSLRRGGFGGMIGRTLNPDFGPSQAHPQLGVSVVGVRDFLIAVNVNLSGEDPSAALEIAQTIRTLRAAGDHRLLGVRALGFPLPTAGQCQVSLNLTLPDITPIDPVLEWIKPEAEKRQRRLVRVELVGVIRERDLPTATRLSVRDEQIVETA